MGLGLGGFLWGWWWAVSGFVRGRRARALSNPLGTRYWAQGVDLSVDKSAFVNTLGGSLGIKKVAQNRGC